MLGGGIWLLLLVNVVLLGEQHATGNIHSCSSGISCSLVLLCQLESWRASTAVQVLLPAQCDRAGVNASLAAGGVQPWFSCCQLLQQALLCRALMLHVFCGWLSCPDHGMLARQSHSAVGCPVLACTAAASAAQCMHRTEVGRSCSPTQVCIYTVL